MVRLTGQRQRGAWARVIPALLLVLLAAAMASATAAAAARPGLDRSLGKGGRQALDLSLPAGASEFGDVQRVSAPDGSTYVLAIAVYCAPACTHRRQFLYRFDPDGRPDRNFGGPLHAVRLPLFPRWGYKLAVDGQDRPLVLGGDKGPQLTRYSQTGHLDRRFGRDGVADLNLPTEFPGVETIPGGRGFLVYTEGEERSGYTTWHLAELTADGRPLKQFGGDGATFVQAAGNFPVDPVVSRSGTVLIGGYGNGHTPHLTRVSSRGRLDTRFNRTTRRSFHEFARLGLDQFDFELTTVLPLAGGGVGMLGWAGNKGFEERLTAAGRPAPGFGKGGLRLQPFYATDAIPLAGGAALAYEEEHHRVRLFVLRADGALDRRFGTLALPQGSSASDLAGVGPDLAQLSWSRGGKCDACHGRFISRFVLPPGEGPVR
jgi:hypothetical protein